MENLSGCKMFGKLIVFLLVISAGAISLTGKTGINYIPDWSSGESFEFNITRIKDIKEPGKPVSSDTVQYTAFFKVIEDEGDKYRINWRFKTDFSASFKIPPEIASQLEEYTNT